MSARSLGSTTKLASLQEESEGSDQNDYKFGSDLNDFGRTLRYNAKAPSEFSKTFSSKETPSSISKFEPFSTQQQPHPDAHISSSRARRRNELSNKPSSRDGNSKDEATTKSPIPAARTKNALVSLDDSDFLKNAKSPRSPSLRSTDSSPRSSRSPQGRLSPLSPDGSLPSPKTNFLKGQPGNSLTSTALKSANNRTSPQRGTGRFSPLSFEQEKRKTTGKKSFDSAPVDAASLKKEKVVDSEFSWLDSPKTKKSVFNPQDADVEEDSFKRKSAKSDFIDDLFKSSDSDQKKKDEKDLFSKKTTFQAQSIHSDDDDNFLKTKLDGNSLSKFDSARTTVRVGNAGPEEFDSGPSKVAESEKEKVTFKRKTEREESLEKVESAKKSTDSKTKERSAEDKKKHRSERMKMKQEQEFNENEAEMTLYLSSDEEQQKVTERARSVTEKERNAGPKKSEKSSDESVQPRAALRRGRSKTLGSSRRRDPKLPVTSTAELFNPPVSAADLEPEPGCDPAEWADTSKIRDRAFAVWYERKAETTIKEKAERERQKKLEEERKEKEKREAQKSGQELFAKWKEEKDAVLRKKIKEKKAKEKELEKQKKKEEQDKIKQSQTEFKTWEEKKQKQKLEEKKKQKKKEEENKDKSSVQTKRAKSAGGRPNSGSARGDPSRERSTKVIERSPEEAVEYWEKQKKSQLSEEHKKQKEEQRNKEEEHESEKRYKEEESRRKYEEWKERKKHEQFLHAQNSTRTQLILQSRPPFRPNSRYK